MGFKQIVGVGVVGCFVIVLFSALDVIVEGIIQAAVILFWLLVAGLVVGGGVIIYTYWQRERDKKFRVIDGSLPMQHFRLADGRPGFFDPNKMVSAAGVIDSVYGYVELPPTAGWDIQRQISEGVQRTRHLAAMFPGDAAQTATKGLIDAPKTSAATTKLLIGPGEKAPVVVAPSALPAPVVSYLSTTDALSKSTGSRWVVGQADDGQLIAFEPERHFSAGVVGATGTGKTSSVGFLLTLAALRAGWHVVVINPDGNTPPPNGGPGWHLFERAVELHETDPMLFPGQVETVYNFYQRRASLSNPRPVLLVFEEYGDTIRHLRKRSRSDADQVDIWLDTLLTRGRKSRVHTAFIDQYPEHWSHSVLGGTKFQAVFKLGPGQGSKLEEYKAGQLPDVGRFLVRGTEYNSFDTTAVLPSLLRSLPVRQNKRIINGTATRVPDTAIVGVLDPVPVAVEHPVQEVDPIPTLSANTTNTLPMTHEEREAANKEAARLFCQKYPAQGVNALARHLAELNGRPDAWRNFQSEGSRWWNKYNPRGTDYQLPIDTMDLSNDADRQQFEQMLRSGAVSFPEPKEKR